MTATVHSLDCRKYAEVPINTLAPHPNIGREILQCFVSRIAEDFYPMAIGFLHVADYEINGERKLWIIDGRQRWAAMMALGLGDKLVHVCIHRNVRDDERCARIFLQLNTFTPHRKRAK